MLKLLFCKFLVLSVSFSVLKLLVVTEQIILVCGEQGYASAGDFTKGFLSLQIIKHAWVRFQVRTGSIGSH